MNVATGSVTDATQLAKDIFLDDLDIPALTVQKIVEEMCGERLAVETILNIGKAVSKTIGKALPERTLFQREPVTSFANNPRLVLHKKAPETVEMAKRGRAQVDVQEKRVWLNDWILRQPRIPTIKEAKLALKAQFGEALGTTYIAKTLTTAHQLVMDERRRTAQANPLVTAVEVPAVGLSDTVRAIAALMQAKGIKKVSVSDEGEIDFETTLRL